MVMPFVCWAERHKYEATSTTKESAEWVIEKEDKPSGPGLPGSSAVPVATSWIARPRPENPTEMAQRWWIWDVTTLPSDNNNNNM